jgi:hypothetical protein
MGVCQQHGHHVPLIAKVFVSQNAQVGNAAFPPMHEAQALAASGNDARCHTAQATDAIISRQAPM